MHQTNRQDRRHRSAALRRSSRQAAAIPAPSLRHPCPIPSPAARHPSPATRHCTIFSFFPRLRPSRSRYFIQNIAIQGPQQTTPTIYGHNSICIYFLFSSLPLLKGEEKKKKNIIIILLYSVAADLSHNLSTQQKHINKHKILRNNDKISNSSGGGTPPAVTIQTAGKTK